MLTNKKKKKMNNQMITSEWWRRYTWGLLHGSIVSSQFTIWSSHSNTPRIKRQKTITHQQGVLSVFQDTDRSTTNSYKPMTTSYTVTPKTKRHFRKREIKRRCELVWFVKSKARQLSLFQWRRKSMSSPGRWHLCVGKSFTWT